MSVHRLFTGALVAVAAASPCLATAATSFKTMYQFGGGTDGQMPHSGLVAASGVFYGTTISGGTHGAGTIFKFDPKTGIKTTLYNFNSGADAQWPQGNLVYLNGSLYGTSSGGGSAGFGTIYRFNLASNTEQVLYSFQNTSDGASPQAGLTYYKGKLYGTTNGYWGDTSITWGSVFKFDLATGTETTLINFEGWTDGANPLSGLTVANGYLYGTTNQGGSNGGWGTVFRIDPNTGAETVIWNFGAFADGASPTGRMVYVNGALYGTTESAGAYNRGTVFKVDLSTGAESVVYSFTGNADGGVPTMSDLINVNGKIYGTTIFGGLMNGGSGSGTIFAFDTATSTESVVHAFNGATDGAQPLGPLLYLNGSLYGNSSLGTTSKPAQYGTLFKAIP